MPFYPSGHGYPGDSSIPHGGSWPGGFVGGERPTVWPSPAEGPGGYPGALSYPGLVVIDPTEASDAAQELARDLTATIEFRIPGGYGYRVERAAGANQAPHYLPATGGAWSLVTEDTRPRLATPTDTFERPDESPATGWTPSPLYGAVRVVGGMFAPVDDLAYSWARPNGLPVMADTIAAFRVGQDLEDQGYLGASVRADISTGTGYELGAFRFDGSSYGWELYRYAPGTNILASDYALTPIVAGDIFMLAAVGTTLTGWRYRAATGAWSQLVQTTQTAFAQGHPAFGIGGARAADYWAMDVKDLEGADTATERVAVAVPANDSDYTLAIWLRRPDGVYSEPITVNVFGLDEPVMGPTAAGYASIQVTTSRAGWPRIEVDASSGFPSPTVFDGQASPAGWTICDTTGEVTGNAGDPMPPGGFPAGSSGKYLRIQVPGAFGNRWVRGYQGSDPT